MSLSLARIRCRVLFGLVAACSSVPDLKTDPPGGKNDSGVAIDGGDGADDGGERRDSGLGDAGLVLEDGGEITKEDGGTSQQDAGEKPDGGMQPRPDGGSAFIPGTRPSGPLPGEVTLWQLNLSPGTLIPRTGESAIIVGPDGTLVIVDVGAAKHADEVRAAIVELNTQWLTTARGFPRARGPREVEWVILTHFHADHIGAFQTMVTGSDALNITKGVIHRGFVDVGPAVNEADFKEVCEQLRGSLTARNVSLCTASPESACVIGSARAAATGCAGLTRGNLADAADDAAAMPSFIDLGSSARLELLGVNGFMLKNGAPVSAPTFGVTDVNEENARSLIGLVRHGAFRYLFAGDLSGSGAATEPDLESFLVSSAPQVFGTLGMDVTHANHHARKTSSNASYVAAAAPADGKSRSVLAGINAAYVNSPHQEVIDAWTQSGRLAQGKLFVTEGGPLAGTGAGLLDAKGRVTVQTIQGGDGYWVNEFAYPSVRR